MRSKDAADELSGKFWATTTRLYLCETLLGETVDLGGVFHPFGSLMGALGVMVGGDGLWGCG